MADLRDRSSGQDDRMQRVRVGVTGLAAVVLVMTLAAALASGVTVAPTPSNAIDSASEPLAQLGAAPGGTPAKAPDRR